MPTNEPHPYFVSDNHALLTGQIGGRLMGMFNVELEHVGNDYTGRIIITQPTSGKWVLTVAPLEED